MGRRVLLFALLVPALLAPAASAAPSAPVTPVRVVSADRAGVLRDGLTLRQDVLVPGFASWQAHLAPAAKAGRISAHAAGPLVTAVLTREVARPGAQEVTLKLTPRGAQLVRERKLARLVIRTSVLPDGGTAATAVRSITLRG